MSLLSILTTSSCGAPSFNILGKTMTNVILTCFHTRSGTDPRKTFVKLLVFSIFPTKSISSFKSG